MERVQTGHIADGEDCKLAYLDYNYFRDYDPSTGRYIESDPIGLDGGVNTFTYSVNSPIDFYDPLGLDINVCFYPEAASGFGHVGFGLPGEKSTSGFYPTGSLFGKDPGVIREDKQEASFCRIVATPPDKDTCMENCRLAKINKPGNYDLRSNQCTSFVRDCMTQCGIEDGDYQGPRPRQYYIDLIMKLPQGEPMGISDR